MSVASTINIGGYTLPVGLESLRQVEDSVGQSPFSPIAFTFDFRGIKFRCTCTEVAPNELLFSLSGRLGPLPFTAESPYARMAAQTIVQSAGRHLNGAINVADGHVVVAMKSDLHPPINATTLVSTIITVLSKITPYISLLTEIGCTPRRSSLPRSHPKV